MPTLPALLLLLPSCGVLALGVHLYRSARRSLAIAVDRMEQQTAPAAMSAAHRLRRIIDVVPHPLLLINSAGQITLANATAAERFAGPAAELIGRPFRDFVSPEFRVRLPEILAECHEQEENQSTRQPLECLAHDGCVFPADICVGAAVLDRGTQLALVIVDVSEQQAATRALQEQGALLAKKNEQLSTMAREALEFVDSVSHDFRTPLMVCKEYASLVREGYAGAIVPEQAKLLQVIESRVDDLNGMVDDMLDVSKLEAGAMGIHRSKFAVSDLFNRVEPTLRQRSDSQNSTLALQIRHDPLPDVFGDLEKAARAIINFGVNAIKFADWNKGQVTLWADWQPEWEHVVIGVTDNGHGIAAEQVSLLYERFRQLDQGRKASGKGFGLGLNIAKQMVSLNFGETGVESTAGQGSTFWFTLPLAEQEVVVRRCLEGAAQMRFDPAVRVCLLQASLPSHADALQMARVDKLLQSRLRPTELCVPVSPGEWQIVMFRTDEDLQTYRGFVQRQVQEMWAEDSQCGGSGMELSETASWPISLLRNTASARLLSRECQKRTEPCVISH